MHRYSNIEPRTVMRICGQPCTLKHMLKVLTRIEVQVHKSSGPVQMFKAKHIWGCFWWTGMNCLHQDLCCFDIYWEKKKSRKGMHIRLVIHALSVCLMTRKGFLQLQEKQECLRCLYWALRKAIVFPQSHVETELSSSHPPNRFSFAHSGSCRAISRQPHHFIEIALPVISCHWKTQMLICK